MQKLTLNIPATKEVYRKHKRTVKLKRCYDNIYRLCDCYADKLISGEWRVAYGYMSTGIDGLLVRHCFFVDRDNTVIDPTVLRAIEHCRKHGNIDHGYPTYYTMCVFPDVKSYLAALLQEERYALDDTLRPLQAKAWEWAAENGMVLAG